MKITNNRETNGTYRWMRRVHLYAGLFLAPWLLIYATSAFLLNHDHWFRDTFKIMTPGWMVIDETTFHQSDKPQGLASEQALSLLKHLNLSGPHRIKPTSTADKLVVLRFSGSGDYRLTWLRQQNHVIIERYGPISIYNYIHSLHFRKGYGTQGPSANIWAVMIDLITLSIWLWVISGIYFWWRRTIKTRAEKCALGAGLSLFAILVMLLYG